MVGPRLTFSHRSRAPELRAADRFTNGSSIVAPSASSSDGTSEAPFGHIDEQRLVCANCACRVLGV